MVKGKEAQKAHQPGTGSGALPNPQLVLRLQQRSSQLPMQEGVDMPIEVECLKKEPQCQAGDPCLTRGSGIGRLTAHEERRANAKLNRDEITKSLQEERKTREPQRSY